MSPSTHIHSIHPPRLSLTLSGLGGEIASQMEFRSHIKFEHNYIIVLPQLELILVSDCVSNSLCVVLTVEYNGPHSSPALEMNPLPLDHLIILARGSELCNFQINSHKFLGLTRQCSPAPKRPHKAWPGIRLARREVTTNEDVPRRSHLSLLSRLCSMVWVDTTKAIYLHHRDCSSGFPAQS